VALPFIPLLGTIPTFVHLEKLTSEPFVDVWRILHARHGTNSYFFFGPTTHLLIRDASLVREILLTHSYVFDKPPIYAKLMGPLLGTSSLLLVAR